MITARAFAGKTYGVYGLARSGRAAAAALRASGAHVRAWDDGEAARAAYDGELTDLNAGLDGLDALVVSPGVPHTAPLFVAATNLGVPVIGDIELFALARSELPPHRVVGITGTNGKSTTTALIHHILVAAGMPARLGGNIGLPILAQHPLPAGGVYVLELSSYQLELTQSLVADVAVLLNVTPDHLDRHGSFANYAGAKARLFLMQAPACTAVVAFDDQTCRDIAGAAIARVVPVSTGELLEEGVSVAAGVLAVDGAEVASQADWPDLQGPHNAQNAAGAVAATLALGLPIETIVGALATYAGLPHRMERVRERTGVRYVNDSKATNPTSAAPALAAYTGIHWIAGGQAKAADLDAVLPALGNVKAAYLIGDATELFAALLGPHVPIVNAGTLAKAVELAASAAQPGDTVLLSPACASFDQFSDYEARGAAFRAAVEAL